jgi:hypothetical protein
MSIFTKKLRVSLFAATLLLGAIASADEYIDDNTSKQVRVIKDFQSIQVEGPFVVRVTQSKTPSLSLIGDNVILPWVVSEVKHGQLLISIKPGVQPHYSKRVEVTVTASSLSSISASDHSFVKVNELQAKNLAIRLDNHSTLQGEGIDTKEALTLTLNNHSTVELDGEASKLLVTGDDHSNSDTDDLDTQEASMTLNNHSTATLSSKRVITNQSDHSSLKLSQGILKITGHLKNHSSIDTPQDETIQTFISNDNPFESDEMDDPLGD